MKTVDIDSRWTDIIDARWIKTLDSSRLLTACRLGTVTEAELRTFLVQQQLYSRHFTRYLCALMANLTDEEDRQELTENLFEEMGLGGLGTIPHSKLYVIMMRGLGVEPGSQPPLRETTELIHRMITACSSADPIVGLSALCLGAEAIVPHVYSQIVHGFVSRGTPLAELEFFRLHIEGDDEHAVTLRKIIDRELGRNPAKLSALRETAQALIEARARFFDAISAEAVAQEGVVHVAAI